LLRTRPDLPLGAYADAPRSSATRPLPAGAVLLFYTDGLVERRGEPLMTSLDRLREAVYAGPAEDVCARVMSVLVGGTVVADDIAVLAIARIGEPVRPSARTPGPATR
jgi:serine phosphatase RsbU (regulator of sigma subunit)